MKRLESTAYHEAGHAVIHYLEDIPMEYVTIIPTEECLGQVKCEIDINEVVDSGREKCEAEIMAVYAGGLAVKIAKGARYNKGVSTDNRIAQDIAMEICSDKEINTFLRWLYIRTEEVLKMNWYMVEAIAKALLKKKQLSGDEVKEIIRRT